MKTFPHYWPFVRGIPRSSVNSPHKGQWRGSLMFLLICAGIKGWVNNRKAGDLRRHRAHYDVIVVLNVNLCLPAFPSFIHIYIYLPYFFTSISGNCESLKQYVTDNHKTAGDVLGKSRQFINPCGLWDWYLKIIHKDIYNRYEDISNLMCPSWRKGWHRWCGSIYIITIICCSIWIC